MFREVYFNHKADTNAVLYKEMFSMGAVLDQTNFNPLLGGCYPSPWNMLQVNRARRCTLQAAQGGPGAVQDLVFL